MVSAKAAVLIFAAISFASAEFPPRVNSVKNMFQNLGQKMTLARRLDAHESKSGPMSEGCQSACPGVKDLLMVYMENMDKMEKGDYSWMCEHMDAAKCMNSEKACQEGDKEGGDDMSMIDCMCKCPFIADMEKMALEDYCDPAKADFDCLFKVDECGSFVTNELKSTEAEWKKGLGIHCKKVDNDCFKKGEAMGQCKAMEGWMTDGCEDAAKAGSLADKKDPCCTHGTSIMKECYSVECMKLDMEEAVHKAEDADAREKEETEKELGKNFEIGKVCTGLGIPTNKDEIKDGPPAAAGDAASGAWKTFLHAIPCVAMVGGLFA